METESQEVIPQVFISYSWTSEEHKQWVLDLAIKLQSEMGVKVILDRWHGNIGNDRFKFMERSIREADKVLVICDKAYCEKANNRRGAVGTESMIFTPDLYANTEQNKIIPIALEYENQSEYLLPDYFKSKFALGMTKQNDFADAFEELGRLIWEEPALVPPQIGKKPNFNKTSDFETTSEVILSTSKEEHVVWLLPRGFLLFSDITYANNSSWSVVVNHYDYSGNWIHGTHYHEGYSDSWDNNIETQFRKLSLPKSDWIWGHAPLDFMRDLRETKQKLDIGSIVKRLQSTYPVYYYDESTPVPLPKVPEQYVLLNKSGKIRDILHVLESDNFIHNYSKNDISALRQRAYLEAHNYFGEKHPGFKFIQEVIDEYNKEADYFELATWCEKLKDTLTTNLNATL